ncbi:hypothetical protein CRYUN_Cryun26dG0032700 [Craigia yunnanensis]
MSLPFHWFFHADKSIVALIYGVNDTSNSIVYPEPNLGGLSARATIKVYPSSLGDPSLASIRGYSSALEVSNLVDHGWDAPDINLRVGVHPEPSLGAVSAAATIRSYSSSQEILNLVGQRRDALVGISPSAGLHPEPILGAASARASIKGYVPPVEDPTLVGQRQDGPLGLRSGIPNVVDEKPAYMRNNDGPAVAAEESNILFVQ